MYATSNFCDRYLSDLDILVFTYALNTRIVSRDNEWAFRHIHGVAVVRS